MQAREAVLNAIHKLHDQRVLSDKSRLGAASTRLQSMEVNAHEKFQALVETCVGKSSQRNSVDSANGTLGKEDLEEDESKFERHSSYSTTSGSVDVEQDSRSSHEMKDTGIDVERPHHILELASARKLSPDLNLNLDSNDSYDPASPIRKCDMTLTAHMAGLHVVKPVKTVSVLGVEVQASDPDAARISSIPPYPHHFYGTSNDVQSPNGRVYMPNASVRPSPSTPAESVHIVSSVNHPTRRSESSFGAETPASASGNRALENYNSRRVRFLFNSQSSFSTTSTANTYNETLRDSSATPILIVARKGSDGE